MSSLIKWERGGLKSPLARARGLGSSKAGVDHWLAQRITAVSNLALGLWLLWAAITMQFATYTDALIWVSEPVNAVVTILFIISSFYHAILGVQVVVEDYIHHEGFKIIKLLAQRLVYFACAAAAIFSVLQIAL